MGTVIQSNRHTYVITLLHFTIDSNSTPVSFILLATLVHEAQIRACDEWAGGLLLALGYSNIWTTKVLAE